MATEILIWLHGAMTGAACIFFCWWIRQFGVRKTTGGDARVAAALIEFEKFSATEVCAMNAATYEYCRNLEKRAESAERERDALRKDALAVFNLYPSHWDLTDGGLFVDPSNVKKFDEAFNSLGVRLGVLVEIDDEDAAIAAERGEP